MSTPSVVFEPSEWDYSQLPPHEWEWRVDQYTDYSVCVIPRGQADCGLHYAVDDFTGLHGAGFQTFTRFLRHGASFEGFRTEMPAATATEIREHILRHRRPGGARLTIVFASRVPQPRIHELDLYLDEDHVRTVHFTDASAESVPNGETARFTQAPASGERWAFLLEAPVSAGEAHALEWRFDFAGPSEQDQGSSLHGKCRFTIETGKKHALRLFEEGGAITPAWNTPVRATFEKWRYDPETDLIGQGRGSLGLHDVPESWRVYDLHRPHVAAFYPAFVTRGNGETVTEYEIKVWNQESGVELLNEVRRYVLNHARNERDGMPVRAVAFSDVGRGLLVTYSLRRRHPAEEVTETERLELPSA